MQGIRLALLAAAALTACDRMELASVRLSADAGEATLFRDVRVFDGTELAAHRDVWVEDGVIRAVGPSGSVVAPTAARVVDGSGRTLLPGLADCHVHLMSAGEKGGVPPGAASIGEAFLFAGVTTVLVTAGGREVTDLVAAQREGRALAPRLFTAGTSLSAPGGHPAPLLEAMLPWPMSWLVVRQLSVASTAAEARERVRATAAEGGHTFTKVIYDDLPPGSPHLSHEALVAALDEARRLGLRPIVHATTAADTLAAVDAGAALLAHVAQRELLTDAQIAHLVAADVPLVSTVSMLSTTHDLAGREPTALERAAVDPEQLRIWREAPDWDLRGFSEEIDRRRDEAVRTTRANFQRLREAGARILVGTDSGVHGVFPGVGLHNEMRLLRELGMSELEILRATTRGAADFLDPEASSGRIEPGARADLLLVRGDPLADLAALAEIEAVYLAGRRLERIGLE